MTLDNLRARHVLTLLAGVLVVAVVWSAWLAWRTERDLRDADSAVNRLQSALELDDDAARDAAIVDLRRAASAAADHTDGPWWGGMTKLPIYGDDLAGVEALSASIDLVARDAIVPLIETTDSLDSVVAEGRVDLDQVASLEGPVTSAASAIRGAAGLVKPFDSSDFVPALRTRYDDYVARLTDLGTEFGAAEKAIRVLPEMLGADGPRDYLFVFQNNAEIRSTGGLPGSWARIRVEGGELELREQGSAGDLNTGETVAELTKEELAVYDELPALYFQDPNFIPDFPRAAEIFNSFWATKYPDVPLDGVLTLDPVAMSYLLDGTGPIEVGDVVLTSENVVAELLSNTYLNIPDPARQDRRFQEVAREIFGVFTSDLASPVDFVRGFAKAAGEGRFLIAPFDEGDASVLEGAEVLGALSGDDGEVPHVDVGLNDGTGSKMSYYLRYTTHVRARSCAGGVQQVEGTMTLNQVISPRGARSLPTYVTGGGAFGVAAGSQLVTIRLYGPYGGDIADVRVDGKRLLIEDGLAIDGRPVVTVAPLIETTKDVIVTWDMTTGSGQTADGEVGVTPSIVPGTSDREFASAC